MSIPARTAAAVVAIVASAAAVIAATAIAVAPGDADGARAVVETEPTPRLGPMLPTLADVEKLTPWPMEVRIEEDGLGPPPGPDFATQPPGCSSLALPSEATSFNNVSWLEARRIQFMPTKASAVQSLQVNAGIVLTASEGVAATFMKDAADRWQKCLAVTYTFGTLTASGRMVKDVEVTPTRLFSNSYQLNAIDFRCEHVMASKGPYIVEGESCGSPPIDVQRWTDAILAQVPD